MFLVIREDDILETSRLNDISCSCVESDFTLIVGLLGRLMISFRDSVLSELVMLVSDEPYMSLPLDDELPGNIRL